MKDGAFGLSSLLAMPPGSLATTDDIVELCKVVGRHGGIFSTHIRNEGIGVFDAIKEAIAIGERAGIAGGHHPHQDCRPEALGPDERDRRPDRGGPRNAASTCRPTSIPTRAATTTWPASFRPGPTKAARRKMMDRLKDAAEREPHEEGHPRGHCPAGTTITRRSAATGAGCWSAARARTKG